MSNQLTFNFGVNSDPAVASINKFFETFEQGAAKAKSVLNKELGQPLETEVILTLKGGKVVGEKIQSLQQDSQKMGALAKALNGQWAKTPKLLTQQVSLLKELRSNTQKYENGTKKVSEEWKKVSGAIKEAEARLKKLGPGRLESMTNALQGTIGKFVAVQTLANLATGAIQGLAAGFGQVVAGGAQMEVLQLQLEAFTGGAENAQMAMTSFIDTAVKTPFNVEQVANAGRIMLGFGLSTDEAIKSTERLAVAASATDGDLNNLARNLGQIQAQGRAYTRDLTQFAIQGIPIWEQMSEVTGKSTVELKKMAEEGQIGFEVVQGAIAAATREGTAFWELAQRMQDTFKGRIEQIVTQLQLMGAEFIAMVQSFDASTGIITGTFNLIMGAIKGLGDAFTFAKDNMQQIISVIGGVGAAIGSLGLVALWANWWKVAKGISEAVKAFDLLNKATKINNALETIRLALSGPKGWAILAAAVGVGAAAYVGLNKVMEDHIEAKEKEQAAIEKSKEINAQEKERMKELVAQYGESEGRMMALEERLTSLQERFEAGEITHDQYKAGLEAIEDEMNVLGAVADGTADKVAALKAEMDQLEAEKVATNERFDEQIKGIDRSKQASDRAHEDTMSNLSKQKDAVKAAADAAKRSIEDQKRAEDDRHKTAMRAIEAEGKARVAAIESSISSAQAASDARIAQLNKEKEATKAAGDAAVQSLQNQKTAMQQQHDARMSQIRAQSEAAISSLQRQKDKIDEITNAQLNAARQLSPAEKELAKIKEDRLRATVANTALSREERLEAQAQLDQMARQAYEAKVMAEAKARQKALDEAITREKEAQRLAEEKTQLAFEARMLAIDEAIKSQEQANANNLAAIDEQIQREKLRADAEMKALEEKKKKVEADIETAKQLEKDRHDAAKQGLDDEKRAIEDKQKADIDAIDAAMEAEKERKEERDRQFEDEKQKIQDQKDEYNKQHKARMSELKAEKDEMGAIKTATDNANTSAQNLKTSYDNLTTSIKNARIEAERLAAAQAKKQSAQQSNSNQQTIDYYTRAAARFAGGPVTGGASYTVNELGKEAFLSASGKLSMINAPSFGTWTAPSSGTVIPAHLTSQLAIPRGGINLNGNVRNSAAAAGASGGLNAMARAIMNAQGGDRINNNVTIQSANTTKAASDILVELTKIRRRRYS